ncbi:MAG: hypothetical protein U1C58_01660 [Flavobacteriaceae bacterium]|nr:hypothetical protein [Flavobacteriaceae bacterium]
MKKLFISIISFASSTIVFGQDSIPKIPSHPKLSLDSGIDHSLSNSSSIEVLLPLFAITLVVILVIQVTRYILEHKLKNKIIDRGISEQLASSIIGNGVADKKDDSIKWAFLLLGLSGGFTVSYYTMPLHLHSLAIMAFSLGLSYLAYFFYLRK